MRVIEMAALSGEDQAKAGWLNTDLDEEAITATVRSTDAIAEADSGPSYQHNYSSLSQKDTESNERLVELADNRFLASASRNPYLHLHVSRLYTGSGGIDYDIALAEHQAIAAALQRRNGAAQLTAAEDSPSTPNGASSSFRTTEGKSGIQGWYQ